MAHAETPQEATVIHQPSAPCVDERGQLQNLLDAPLGSVVLIHSVPGAVRGNHYHKTDYHYCWLQSGGLDYAHRPVG